MRVSIIIIGLGIMLGAVLIAGAVQAQTNDHLKCYQVKGDLKLKGLVDIETPQFGLEPGCKIKKAKFFCAPATKSNVDVVDGEKQPITPLLLSAPPAPGDRICWQVKCPEPFPPDTEVTDQFGTQTLTKFKTKLLCTPAVKGTEFCGDGVLNGSEECDGVDDVACPDLCQADCSCGPSCLQFPATGQMKCYRNDGEEIPCMDTGKDGDIQAGATLAYKDHENGTITDLNTGLMWEKKDDNNVNTLHDVNTTYRWEDTFAVHVAGLNAEPFAGHTDWRVPNVKELQSIVDFATATPAIDPVFNNNTCVPNCDFTMCSCTLPFTYWSSTTDSFSPAGAWVVNFERGMVISGGSNVTGFQHRVRAVRGGL